MKIILRIRGAALLAGLSLIALPARLPAQTTSPLAGRIEFSARVSPTGGRPEPVRQMTFYLLRKSLDDIRAEALQLEPLPDFDKYVDGLEVSPELKNWMKKHHTLRLVGPDFTKSLTADEVVDVPEFFTAYISRNMGIKGAGFPEPKFKASDREAHPQKFKEQKEDYIAALRKFAAATPETIQGIDSELTKIDVAGKWEFLLSDHRRRLENRASELAQQRYLVAQTDTDLDGRGSFAGIAPGSYWIGMLGMQAISGDVHLQWDVLATVQPGETTHVQLSNLNAVKPYNSAQNSLR